MFATSCGNWANPLEFVDLISESTGFFQKLGCARLATPNPYRGKHRQCRAARGRLRLGRQIRRRDSIVPMAARQLEPAVAGLQVGMKADELGFFGQRQRLDHQRLCLIKAKLVKQAPDQADIRATGILDIVDGQRNTHSFVQIFMAAGICALPPGQTEVGQGMGEHRSCACGRRQCNGSPGQCRGLLGAVGEHGELRLIAQRKRKQPLVADTAEDDGRFLGGCLRVSWSAVEPHDSGQPAQAQPEGARIRELSAQRDSATLSSGGIDGRSDRVALYGTLLEEVGQLG